MQASSTNVYVIIMAWQSLLNQCSFFGEDKLALAMKAICIEGGKILCWNKPSPKVESQMITHCMVLIVACFDGRCQ